MAQIQKGTTYITGDQVTAANLNALADSAILLPGAITDQTAKTVPLAADTVLIHSAADTALRKSTLTQLFASPQPIGATTASTGAFTTLSASGAITGSLGATVRGYSVPSSGSGMELFWDGTESIIQSYNRTSPAYQPLWLEGGTLVRIGINSVQIAGFSSTGLAVTGALSSTTGANFATSSGNVGVGLSSPAYKFQVQGAAGNILSWTDGTTPGTLYSGGGYVGLTFPAGTGGFFINTAGNFNTISTNGIERLRVDSSGNVLVGVTANTGVDTGVQRLVVTGIASGNGGALGLISDSLGRNIILTDSSKTYVGAINISSTAMTVGTNSGLPLLFFSNSSERARIDSSGNLGVGTDTPSSYTGQLVSVSTSASKYAGVFYVNAASSDSIASIILSKSTNVTTSSQVFAEFYVNAYSNASGRIVANGASAAAFAAYSDSRLKENITDLPSQLNNILSLRPVEFDYKDGSGHQIGFIAQEVEQVYPDLIAKGKDDMLTLAGLSKNEARFIKAIQELNANLVAQVAALSQRLAALESN
jgi:hypothetical protein